MEEHIEEQITFRRKMIEICSKIYNESNKEIRKHQTMLAYYLKQQK